MGADFLNKALRSDIVSLTGINKAKDIVIIIIDQIYTKKNNLTIDLKYFSL